MAKKKFEIKAESCNEYSHSQTVSVQFQELYMSSKDYKAFCEQFPGKAKGFPIVYFELDIPDPNPRIEKLRKLRGKIDAELDRLTEEENN